MKAVVKRLYEAMFLVDSVTEADGDKTNTAIKKILEKAGAEIVSIKKWDERRLAYEIDGKNRGTYILCYFHADSQRIRQIERDAQLSEMILRVLILNAEGREASGDVTGALVPDDVSDKENIERDIASQSAGRPPAEAEDSGHK